jgi:hypothetical protein
MRFTILVGGLIMVLLFSGCILGFDSKGVAHELKTARETYVQEGLLSPTSSEDRTAYHDELLVLRKRVQENGGLDAGTLNDYVDGSLSLLAMHESLSNGNTALETTANTIFDCTKSGFAGQALLFFQAAKESSQSAHDSFVRVLENASMANELGVNFLQNAVNTTESTTQSYATRINDIKTTCGLPI